MIRNWKVTAAIASMLVMAGLGAGLVFGLGGPSSVAAPPLTKTEQARLEQSITALTVSAEAGVLAVEVRSQFEQAGKPLLSPGSHLSIDAATFQAVSAQVATVDAMETGAHSGRWQLTLVREAGHWQLLGTRKLS
jgi:predicted membrane-bound mannosyltransferase